MEQHVRDLGSAELWDTSLERSLRRREWAHDGRRRMARKKQASTAVTAAMLMTPVLQVSGAMAGSKGKSEVAQSSPANRAIDSRTLDVELREGDTGTRVAQLQQLLGVDADGIFGKQTAAAVRAFQARSGLEVDGIVGRSTWRALFAGSGTQGAAADAVVEGKGYQVSVSRATKAEAKIAGEGKGPVAKIVLTRSEKPASSDSSPSPSHDHKPSKRRASSADDRRDNVGGPTPRAEEAVEERTSSPPSQGATQPAVDTGEAESVACGSDRLTSPVKGTKTSGFGPRGGRNHDGVDIAAPTGTPVHAAACGVVTTASAQGAYGNLVCIDHGGGFTTCYAHMSGFNTRAGQQVEAGDVIGYVGSTGRSTGPHLHFETRVNGQARNPQPYLDGSQRAPGSRSRTAPAKSTSGEGERGSARTRTADSRSSSNGAASAGSTETQSSTADASTSEPSGAKPSAIVQGRPAPAPAQQQQAAAPAPAPAEQPAATAAPTAPAPVEQPAIGGPDAPVAPAPAPEAPAAPAAEAPAPVEQPAAPAPEPVQPAAPAAEPAPAAEAAPAPEAAAPEPAAEAAPAPAPEAAPAPAPAPAAEAPAPAAEAPAPAAESAAPAAPAAEQPAPAAAG